MNKIFSVFLIILFFPIGVFAIWHRCRCTEGEVVTVQSESSQQSEPTPAISPQEEAKSADWKIKFWFYKSEKNGQWYWHTESRNGRIIGDSGEGYHNKGDCLHGISLMKQFASTAEVVEGKKP